MIIVTGATGQLGQGIIEQLLTRITFDAVAAIASEFATVSPLGDLPGRKPAAFRDLLAATLPR